MFKYSIKLILRQLLQGKRQLLLNVLGLSVAFALTLFLSTFIFTELNRGKSIENYQNLYKLSAEKGNYWSSRSIKEFTGKFSEIKGITKAHEEWSDRSYYEVDKKQYNAGKILYADKYFFDVFNYEIIAGALDGTLAVDDNIILTKTEALKIFGKIDVVGKTLKFRTSSFGEMDFNVAAVIKDLPLEALMTFDAIIPVMALKSNVAWYKTDHWGQTSYEVFVSLVSAHSKTNIENQLNTAFQSAAPDWAKQDKGKIFLQSYKNLYFSEQHSDVLLSGSMRRVKILGTVMIIVFLLALINFINLNTAQKIKQSRDAGIHKVMGAGTCQSLVRIITEIIPVLFITLFFAALLIMISLPLLNQLFDSSFRFSSFLKINTLVTGLCIVTLTLFFSTVFIASYFHQKNLFEILKSNTTGKKENLRNALLVIQFTLSIALIIASLIINKQNSFMQNHSMGFQKDNIVYLPLHEKMAEQAKTIKQELSGISEVTSITMASQALGKSEMGWGMSLNNNGEEKRIGYEAMRVDKNFFDFFGIEIVDGENFRSSSIHEKEHIFNETAIKTYGIENIKNAHISSYDEASGEIIGVVKDFNFESLHHAISPIGFICSEPENLEILYLNLQANNGEQLQNTLGKIEFVWNDFANGWPFEYHFLDQTLNNLYKEDRKFSKVFLLVTMLSVFIGCLGLFSTSIFIAEMRTKEIGIRKVNGAQVSEILAILNKDFIKWVAVSFVVAIPVSYYAMNKWLENFAYKTNLSWWIFALAGLLALGIALLTVSWHSWRAATKNPVEALRYE
ncbi:ABC transporter permease [Maribellus maritimus]|uniref:ABC transporter permease n=1 Tax=Maribellus maritimus TaxID=2870838 RepID=UPI001EEA3D4A|nr:ABC transporter permease [Maribellus maritimus]MCG6189788.1 ABC transporter permease [Maribellus maritimus]